MPTFTIKTSSLIQEGFDFGLDDYPIFDEEYRESLNKKILDHYWNYEIGQETESMFRFSLNRKMREIMPYYNQLYKSTQIEFDPLQTMKYTDLSRNVHADTAIVEGTQENTGTETSNGVTTSDTLGKSRSVSSTTPQVQLSGDEDYASNAADVNSNSHVTGDSNNTSSQSSNSTANSTSNNSGTGTIDREVSGSQGIASELLMLYRATFLNIDMEVIKNLESLFMQIWDNGDEFSNSSMNGSFGYGYRIF